MTVSGSGPEEKIIIWRDERFWKIAFQVITVVLVITALSLLITNFSQNLARQGTTFGFSFLRNSAGFGVGEALVEYQPQDPYVRVIQAGLINSLRMIVVGIVLATVVGIIAGVASFSENWLVYKLSRAYVGLVRNVPLLLQLFFWYFAVFFQFPPPQEQINLFGLIILSKRGVTLPGPALSDQNWLGLVLLIAALFIGGLLWKLVDGAWARGRVWASPFSRAVNGIIAVPVIGAIAFLVFQGLKRLISGESTDGFSLGAGAWIPVMVVGLVAVFWIWQQRTKAIVERGSTGKSQLYAMGAILLVTALIFIFGLGWEAPEIVESGGATGGLRLSVEYAAGVSGLVFYTGAFIAEIVRGGIQSVSKGQWEAARSLGLPSSIAMRLVVFPQALRVIIPPLNSEYMNLAKNSTLAFAIGYPELYSVSSTTSNQTGRPVEVFLIIMASYLIFNLLISVSMNQLNELVQLRER
ncbi:MAG: ABC transporter permease subunit [Leptolyngbyaceae bacterium]|nr:ABC transporter permease subunit [Leptolyngbyaceae bacterium]